MKVHINKIGQIAAQLLLFLFLLESCQNANVPLQRQSTEEIKPFSNHFTLGHIHGPSTSTTTDEVVPMSPGLTHELQLAKSQELTSNSYLGKIDRSNVTSTRRNRNRRKHNFTTKLVQSISRSPRPTISNTTSANRQTNVDPTSRASNTIKNFRDQQNLIASQEAAAAKRLASSQSNVSHDMATLLENQVCMAREGYQVEFEHNQKGGLQAIVEQQSSTGFTRQILPVTIEQEFSCLEAIVKNPAWQKQYIHVTKNCVYVGHMGLLGGGKDKEKGKEKEDEDEEVEVDKKSHDEYQIKDLQEFIEVAANNAEKAKDKDIILVLGKTGSGKSTIINYLLGSELEEADTPEGDVIVKSKDPQKEWAKIGHGLKSETFLPSVYSNDECPFVYCDCPGFNDTRTKKERLNTTIATQLIVNAAERIRAIIVIVDVMDLTHGRGAGMRDISTILSQLLKRHMEPNSFLFVFNNKTGRKMNVDSIHLKVKALEKIEGEKLEKLAKIQEEDKGSQEEYRDTSQILSMLKMISVNKDNTFLINLFDEFESKITIEKMLSGLQVTPKTCFSFSDYDDTRVKFNNQLTKVVADLSNKMMVLLQATENVRTNTDIIESCEERIEFYKNQIGLLDPEQQMKNENKIQEIKEQIKWYNQKIDNLTKKQTAKTIKSNALVQEKVTLDTDEEIIYWEDSTDKPRPHASIKKEIWHQFGFGAGSQQIYTQFYFKYESTEGEYSPYFTKRITSTSDGHFTYERFEKGWGYYSAGFVSDPGKDGFAKVSIYLKKKHHPNNRARILQINKKVEQCEATIKKFEREIEEEQRSCKNMEALIEHYKADVEAQRKQITDRKQYLEGVLARIGREKAAAELNNKEQQKIKEDSEKYLSDRKQLLAGVNTILSHDIGKESTSIEEFKAYYQHYTKLLEQGEDYLLSLPEKALLEYLICQLRQDKFLDPVIASCGHTFSQQDLLVWLSRQKNCPTCRMPIVENELKPNLIIRQAIEEFEQGNKKFGKREDI
jgi:energy-coupling factor transporter ATP-binding protein EcfA2